MEKLYAVSLSYMELMLLDDIKRESVQKVIETAKLEASFGFDLPVMNEILVKSQQIGKLGWRLKSINSCGYCDKKRDYYKYPRSGRNHRKGESNYSKPKSYNGIAFNEGFITFSGVGDMCSDCLKSNNVIERLVDCIIERDLKIQIQRNDYKPTRYIRDDIRICYKCAQEMPESKMSKERTMMGDGWYPCGCPHCGAKTSFFGANHKTTQKFEMLAAQGEI